jgi:hypothetical protein
MPERECPAISVDELERLVRGADSSALLVLPRVLRRVIKRDRGLPFLGLQFTHRKSYVITGEALRAIVEPNELGLPHGVPYPETAVLLARPEAEELAGRPRDEVLAEYWRLLFQARAEAEVVRRFAAGALTDASLPERVARIGRAEFAEARAVLRQDGYLLPPRTDRAAYAKFVAVFLELRRFSPALLPHVFPAIDDAEAVERVFAPDVDGGSLAAATRPAGAPEPMVAGVGGDGLFEEEPPGSEPAGEPEGPGPGYDRWTVRRAEAVAARGNHVRAAVLWTDAAGRAGPAVGRRARRAARGEIDRLCRRLQGALGFGEVELDRWRRALPPLLDRAARGFWTPEARLLYDLQKVCDDHERDVFTVDLVEWVRSLGRRPIKRSLPHLRTVLIVKHLRAAARRLPATRLPRDVRDRLEGLLRPAADLAEEALRACFRPVVDGVLSGAGFLPRNLPERVAYRKLIEELLDRVAVRGFLTIGDLRDACSRSHLKMPDLSGLSDSLGSTRLLRADAALAEALDGVHRRGEVYLRLLQRLSALAFATPPGRFLTRFAALPYGGTYVALKGVQHLLELVRVEVHRASLPVVLVIGTVALGLINFPKFRDVFLRLTWWAGRALRAVFVDLPARVARLPLVRRVLASRAFRALWRYVIKPALVLSPFWLLGRRAGLGRPWELPAAAAALAGVSVVLNSRAGRDAEEILAEGVSRAWRRLWFDLLPGLFRLVMDVFQRFVEDVERVLYAVDEWLRFRSGQRRASLAVKGVLGFFWFFISYIVRFYVNLLIEPQVNPIKHFPVVTVSHKIILPLSKTLTLWLAAPLMPLGEVPAYFLAGSTVLLLPGVFGFLVWELKENWRLYEANRPESLRPVPVGGHGETLVRLLRPGVHSGTLPKLFAKLRRAERRVLEAGHETSVPRYRESLHHVETDVGRFVDREFLALLGQTRAFGPAGVRAGEIDLATNRIRVILRFEDEPACRFLLTFVEESGCLRASVSSPSGLHDLSHLRRRAFATALLGFFKLSGVDVVGEDGEGARELVASALPPLDQTAAPGAFSQVSVAWRDWVAAWDVEMSADSVPVPHAEGVPFSLLGGRDIVGRV